MKTLTNHGIVDDLIYEVEELDINEALELFRWDDFRNRNAWLYFLSHSYLYELIM
jgi:hypothetical protein